MNSFLIEYILNRREKAATSFTFICSDLTKIFTQPSDSNRGHTVFYKRLSGPGSLSVAHCTIGWVELIFWNIKSSVKVGKCFTIRIKQCFIKRKVSQKKIFSQIPFWHPKVENKFDTFWSTLCQVLLFLILF